MVQLGLQLATKNSSYFYRYFRRMQTLVSWLSCIGSTIQKTIIGRCSLQQNMTGMNTFYMNFLNGLSQSLIFKKLFRSNLLIVDITIT